ncbi:hypothetical protein [Solirubrum puertoriconensis]|uniref:Uncharacterized protein n=1 Tax=Solirubrum puertoriconensis TaxID=1751427 RepID=A0A9X0L2T6_SOLP1|nr:hypothetical protein [Solirubrum puertoriconensis]KUG05827.1 hypothetical protein ASU33_00090 [Solirubrum puertoriconensis]
MQRLIDAVEYGADFFVEEVQVRAIVFDNSDDVTLWATTVFDGQTYFFHLGLPFAQLDLLLRQAGVRSGELQEEVADALATAPRPCLLEYTAEGHEPFVLPDIALKLSFTYPADEDEFEDDEDEESEERSAADNVFYLEGIYRRLDA